MLATAQVPHLLYGFCNMKEDSLVLSGEKDIWSSSTGFVSESGRRDKYYTPNNQINKTKYHNEMDFARFQNGQRKQPDYILAFRENGKIAQTGDILQAYKDWEEKIPIVVVDVEKCLTSEREKVEEMLAEYRTNKTKELGEQIVQKIENNRKKENTKSFCKDLNLEIKFIKSDIKRQKIEEIKEEKEGEIESDIDIATLQKNFDMVTAEERKEKMSDLRLLRARIQEMMKGGSDGQIGK